MWCNGTPDNCNVNVQPNPSQSQYPRRSTYHDLGSMQSNIIGDETNKYGEGYRPICPSSSRDPWCRSPYQNLIGGTCLVGASLREWHDQSTAQQPGIPLVSDGPNFVNGTNDITFRGPRNQSPSNNFLNGRSYWHDPSAPQQPGIQGTSSIPGFVSGSLGMYTREHRENQHQDMRTESFVNRNTPYQFSFQGQGHLHPFTIYERTRYDNGIHQFQGQRSIVPPRNYCSYEGNVGREVNYHRMHSLIDDAVNDHNTTFPTNEQVAWNGVRMDVISSSQSLDRKRQSFASDYGGDNRRPVFWPRFTKGKEQFPIGSANSCAGIPIKKNGVCAANASNPRHPYQKHEKLVTNSSLIEAAEGASVVGVEHMKSVLRSSSKQLRMSLQDAATAVVEEDGKGELMLHLSKDGDKKTEEMTQGVKTFSRKKRKRGTKSTPCSVELSTEERTGSSSQRSVMGVSDTMNTSAAKVNVMEYDLVNELPVQRQGNRLLTNNVKSYVETLSATTAGHISHNHDGYNDSLASLQCVGTVAPTSRRKLLVLDVNGLLADIVADFPGHLKPDMKVSGKGVFKRPFCDAFLDFCFERFDVGIWSSRMEQNLTRVVKFLMKKSKDRLLFCWDQSRCTRTGYKTVEDQVKPMFLKELEKLWENKDKSLPWERGFYNETNTVLLDDSPYKALLNPPYTAIFPFPYLCEDAEDKSLGRDGDLRLYLEKLAGAENVQTFIEENPFGQRAISETNPSWGYYSKIIDRLRCRVNSLKSKHDKKINREKRKRKIKA